MCPRENETHHCPAAAAAAVGKGVAALHDRVALGRTCFRGLLVLLWLLLVVVVVRLSVCGGKSEMNEA